MLSFRGIPRSYRHSEGAEQPKESCLFVILRRKPKNPTKGKSGLRSWDASHSFSMTVRTIEKKGNNYDKKA